MNEPRDLVGVIRQIVAIAPDLSDVLEDIRTSAMYAAPELMGMHWRRAAKALEAHAIDHPNKDEIRRIFAGADELNADGKEAVYFIDQDDAGFGYLAHCRKTAHQWLDSFLDELEAGEPYSVRFKLEYMTKEELEKLPEI